MKKIIFLTLILSINFTVFSQPVWTFDSGIKVWKLAHSVRGSRSSGVFNIKITGGNPYILSPKNLGIDAIDKGKIKIRMQNLTTSNQCRLSWITTADQKWNMTKSVLFTVNTNDTAQTDYTLTMHSALWTGTIKQIRLGFGNNIVSGNVKIYQIEFLPFEFIGIDNGTIHLRFDLSRGGAIAYISKSGVDRNIVNVYDEGRYIQQAYYAGKDTTTQSTVWKSWAWNPIQAGDTYGNRAQMLDYSLSGDTLLYTKCIPKLWVMNNKPAEAIMEQTTVLKNNVIKVTNKITCKRTDTIYGEGIPRNQEQPAVYLISALKNLYLCSNDTLRKQTVSKSPDPWGEYYNNLKNWMAFVDDNQWGLGVYNPNCTTFGAGLSGQFGCEAHDASTCYIAPIKQEAFNKNTVYEYTYYLVIGDLNKIRSDIDSIHLVLQTTANLRFATHITNKIPL